MKVRVRVPATSANLGPGFDALGLALALHNELTMGEADAITVSVVGEGTGQLATDGANIVARAARMLFEAADRPFRGVAVECVNRIPIGRGLGSSAAAWLGGLLGANALLGEPLDRASVLALAARAEGHPDNVAAALHGGLTVCCEVPGGVVSLGLPVPGDIRWVALVPEVASATADARAVLPASVPRGDAVFNVQRVALLLASLWGKRADLLHVAMTDRLHQPYRMAIFPWIPAVVEAAREAGALGCVLSGAGPSLLAAVAEDAEGVARAMTAALRAAGLAGTACALDIDTSGAVVEPC